MYDKIFNSNGSTNPWSTSFSKGTMGEKITLLGEGRRNDWRNNWVDQYTKGVEMNVIYFCGNQWMYLNDFSSKNQSLLGFNGYWCCCGVPS